MSGSLGEREMLWEHGLQASVSTACSIGTQRTCFLFILENTAAKKKERNNLLTLIIKM